MKSVEMMLIHSFKENDTKYEDVIIRFFQLWLVCSCKNLILVDYNNSIETNDNHDEKGLESVESVSSENKLLSFNYIVKWINHNILLVIKNDREVTSLSAKLLSVALVVMSDMIPLTTADYMIITISNWVDNIQQVVIVRESLWNVFLPAICRLSCMISAFANSTKSDKNTTFLSPEEKESLYYSLFSTLASLLATPILQEYPVDDKVYMLLEKSIIFVLHQSRFQNITILESTLAGKIVLDLTHWVKKQSNYMYDDFNLLNSTSFSSTKILVNVLKSPISKHNSLLTKLMLPLNDISSIDSDEILKIKVIYQLMLEILSTIELPNLTLNSMKSQIITMKDIISKQTNISHENKIETIENQLASFHHTDSDFNQILSILTKCEMKLNTIGS
jgi:hypothetical protein